MSSRINSRIVAVLFVSVALLAPGRALRAQPLADRIPADALVYIGWAGAEHMGPGYDQSRLKAVLEASDFPKLINESLPKFFQKIGASNQEAAEFTGLFSAIGGAVWKHPTAFYFGGVDMTNPRSPMPKLALICDAGPDGPALVAQVQKAVASTGAPLQVQQQGGTVTVSVGAVNLANVANSLPNSAKFKSAAQQVGGAKNAVASVYIDVEGIVAMADQMVPKEDPEHGKTWAALKSSLGLSGVKRAIWSAGFDGKDWMGQAFVEVPAPRQGLIPSLFEAKPLTDAVFKSIPQSATVASAGHFDLGALFRNIRATVASVDANAGQQFEGGLAQVKQMLGLDVQTDLLDVLGDEWAIYIDPPSTGSGMLGFVLVNRARDAAKLEASLTRLEDLANALIKQNMEENMTIEVKRAPAGDATLHYFAVPFISPTWSVKNGNLYVGLYPQVVAGAIDNAGSGKSILDNPEFQAVRQRLGAQATGANITGFSFANLPQTAPDGYQELMMVSRISLGFADMFGADTPALVLPPLRKILPHLIPAGGVSWVDQTGWHHKTITPFPGAGALTPGAGGQVVIAQQAVLASILLPSLNRARETANRVKCGSNMRQIGQAILLYSNENKGKYPPDLATLIKTQDITAEVFVCPSGNTALPNLAAMKPDEIAKWVNDNSDYVYVGRGMNSTAGAEVVVLYEKPNAHGRQGMNILYGDGHVDFLQMPGAMQEIQRSQQQRQNQGQPPPRRQIQ
jgi:prepilin-type processing-associated H-X9-DG protein